MKAAAILFENQEYSKAEILLSEAYQIFLKVASIICRLVSIASKRVLPKGEWQ
jgi:hypothetical protein